MKNKKCPWCDHIVWPNQLQKYSYHKECFDEHKADYLADLKKDERKHED